MHIEFLEFDRGHFFQSYLFIRAIRGFSEGTRERREVGKERRCTSKSDTKGRLRKGWQTELLGKLLSMRMFGERALCMVWLRAW